MYHNRLRVCCVATERYYYNYEKNKLAYKEKHESKDYFLRFYMYYDDSQDFIDLVSKRSGKPVEVINYPEE